MEITVDQDKRCGVGQCVLLASEVFDQGEDDGLAGLTAIAAGLGEDPVDVRLHGGFADEQRLGDLVVGQAWAMWTSTSGSRGEPIGRSA
ncbi:hypothetical protein GCM10010517_60610 [Streptosporangium fragile]|uniref:Ferredoxin n=1 Tax=Streptosporangium fragile TaxID=46186 RepID=A0ABP6IMS2_9ACTN